MVGVENFLGWWIARYFNNFMMDFLEIVKSWILFIAQVISQKKSIKLLR
jgi:hypothetical protein